MAGAHLLSAHSLEEAQLYVHSTPCGSCQSGPVQVCEVVTESRHIDDVLRVEARCARCAQIRSLRFKVDARCAVPADPPIVNPTASPSEIIDVVQWITLAHELIAESEAAAARETRRKLAYRAGLCLDEALKFYEPDNDLPPQTAFFDPGRRRQAMAHPQPFGRAVLIALRRRLPAPVSIWHSDRRSRTRRWWRPWQ